MEKRLPLALLLSFLVLFGWKLMFPAPIPAKTDLGDAQTVQDSVQGPGHLTTPKGKVLGAGAGGTGVDASSNGAGSDSDGVADTDAAASIIEAAQEERIELEFGVPGSKGSYLAEFTNRGAGLAELRIGNWYSQINLSDEEKADRANWTVLCNELNTGAEKTSSFQFRAGPSSGQFITKALSEALWEMRVLESEGGRPIGIEFEYAPGTGLHLKKRILHVPDTYEFALEIELINDGAGNARPLSFFFTPAYAMPPEQGDRFYQEPQAFAVGRDEIGADEDDYRSDVEMRRDRPGSKLQGNLEVGANVLFGGSHNKYFAMLMRAATPAEEPTMAAAYWRRLPDQDWVDENPTKAVDAYRSIACDLQLNLKLPAQGESAVYGYKVYCGPKDREELQIAQGAHDLLVQKDLGFFDGIASGLLKVLGFFHSLVGNWGFAIILLTLSVRLMLFPINRRSQTAMARYQKKMKRVQPKIEEIKKKYEKDPQKLRSEQAKLMQEEGAFPPLGGCLPMFLQIPVFFGLFSALRTSFDLRQAPFVGWIRDLSMPDRMLQLNFNTHLPMVGTIEWLNVLPPIMVVLWVLQQRMMPKPADEQAAKMQKMMMWMPIMMGFFLYNYAAGLSLYMITQSAFGMLEMGFIRKKWPLDDAEQPKKTTGFMAKLAAAQKEQMRRMEEQKKLGGKPGAQRAGGGSGSRKPKSRKR